MEEAAQTRFVIHKHTLSGQIHWDLMIEYGDILKTWRIENPPQILAIQKTKATPIFDHDKKFLTYQGSVNNGKGTVEIVENGLCTVKTIEENEINIKFDSNKLKGQFKFVFYNNEWTVLATEKEIIEHETAKAFIKLYNSETQSFYKIIRYGIPDIVCKDKKNNELKLEITLTEDRDGDIQALLGRSNARTIETLEKDLSAVERGEKSIFDIVSCFTDVLQMATVRIQKKLNKDYGSNTALVVRDTSGVCWDDWDTTVKNLVSLLDLTHNPFDKGIWILSSRKDKIFRVV